ncbi:SycD/LcrH family type III secretion system chaperone [Escherichia albertii]|nr:SycD/LcrH family type III secretion system chaperone [Escherichia albertii]MCZ8730155.1 SycD/LcrH family type III secretion system chaperone [Escherichia albertii]MCZ8882253.1 SycD/LcrH family type III secretion system chaperone [Escherichia albertii]MCZ8894767.1 SycD/LcrH family type III secretion system chaperone [Escherichia albertii]
MDMNDLLMEDVITKIPEKDREQFVKDALASGVTRKQLYNIPDDLMHGFYACAYEYYQNGEIEKSEHFFKFLMMYDFYNPDYAFGLAAVYQMKEEYKSALDIYALAFALQKDDDDDYRALFEAGQCYMHLKNYAKAKDAFEAVVANEKDAEQIKRAEIYLKALTNMTHRNEDNKDGRDHR